MEHVIQTNNLTKSYGKSIAVNNVSLTLNKGDIYGLIGKNGAGKTTLFKMIMGLAQQSSGSIDFFDNNSQLNASIVRRSIGFMMGTSFYPYLNAHDNLEYLRKVKGIGNKEEIDRVLKLVDLYGVKKKYSAFSMGMKQRLGIANALLGNPSIIILDEPINGLDPQGISDIRKLIQNLNQQYGITFIVSSHILGELSMMATRFGFINNGKLIEELDQEQLHDKTTCSLVIKVDNVEKACYVLEQQLETENYLINERQEIILNDYLTQPELVSQSLFENNIKLYKIYNKETTLEDYFLGLIGGNNND